MTESPPLEQVSGSHLGIVSVSIIIEDIEKVLYWVSELSGNLWAPFKNEAVHACLVFAQNIILVFKAKLHIVHKYAGIGTVVTVIQNIWNDLGYWPDMLMVGKRQQRIRYFDFISNLSVRNIPGHVEKSLKFWWCSLGVSAQKIINDKNINSTFVLTCGPHRSLAWDGRVVVVLSGDWSRKQSGC